MEAKELDTILSKSFNELSAIEREEMKDYFQTEEEFLHIKEVFLGVEAIKVDQIQPKKATKDALDQLFALNHPKGGTIWYNSVLTAIYPTDKSFVRRPLVQVAAVLLLVVLAFPLANKLTDIKNNRQLAKQEQVQAEALREDQEVLQESEIKNERLETDQDISSKNKDFAQAEQTIIVDEVATRTIASDERSNTIAVSDLTLAPTAAASGYVHPDGIYKEVLQHVDFSTGLNEQVDVLDLLTTTF